MFPSVGLGFKLAITKSFQEPLKGFTWASFTITMPTPNALDVEYPIS